MDAKTIDIVIESLAETIRNLRTENFLKDMEIRDLKEKLDSDRPVKAVEENG